MSRASSVVNPKGGNATNAATERKIPPEDDQIRVLFDTF
jgi:hypothetical protein